MAIERTDIIRAARSWIGTPYVHQASVKGVGCDCLGLLRGVWRELHGDEPETAPPYSPDWAEATGEETLYIALSRHLREIDKRDIAPGDVALFRMLPNGPAKHCGILASTPHGLTLIHARQNKQVSEEAFTLFWRRKLAFVFRIYLDRNQVDQSLLSCQDCGSDGEASHMHRIAFVGLMAMFCVTAPARAAEDLDKDWKLCVGADQNAGIRACTALIESGHLETDDLAQVYANRGMLYLLQKQNDLSDRDYARACELSDLYCVPQ